jgi:acyl dehydratase
MIAIGETAQRVVTLDEASIRDFATACGDFNPLHHDPDYARGTRFGGIIACGPHYIALLMGLLASHYTRHGPQVGIGFDAMRLVRPVRPGDTIMLSWVVRAIEPKTAGDVVTLDGAIVNQDGATVLTVIGKIMAFRT